LDSDTRALKVVGLFAGVGGFEVGFASAGHRTILLSEIWEPAVAVLRERFPGVPVHEDVRTLHDLPADTEVLAAGFPCQDLSQAGKTAGISGSRSSLVDEVFRLLHRRRVPWVVLENVSFMLQLGRGRAMSYVLDRLEELGYRWAYRVVSSLAFLPQRRERVFILASTEEDPASVLLGEDVTPHIPDTDLDRRAHGFYWTEGIRGLGWAVDAIPTLKNGSTIGIPSPPAILLPDGKVVKPDIRDAERLQGFREDWTAPAVSVARPSLRWSLMGNAVTVPVAAWLGRRLACPAGYDRGRDRLPIFGPPWPPAARFDGVRRIEVGVGAFPVWHGRPPLHEYLRYPGIPLSRRATAGFLSRTARSSLRFPPGFLERVRAHLERMSDGEPAARELVSAK